MVFGALAMGLVLLGPTAHSEDTKAPKRFIAADYSTRRLGAVSMDGKLEWELPIRDIHDLWILPNGNLLLQTNWTRVLELSPDRKLVWSYDSATMNGNSGQKVEVHAFQRLENGLTMIAESGPGRIIEVDREGRIQHQIQLKRAKPDAHRDTRLARKLKNGNYLVAQEGEGMVREYDPKGSVVWEYDVKSQVYAAVRLDNGNTLIGAGGGSRVLEVSKQGQVVWSVEKQDIPGVTLAWVTHVDRLPNGNTTIVNCHAGPENPQFLEITPQKKAVWAFKDFKNFGNSTPVVKILP